MMVVGVVAVGELTTSFSSTKTCTLSFSVLTGVTLFRAAALARFPRVGTLLPEVGFLTSIGLAVTFRATIELLLLPNLGTWGVCGVLELGVKFVGVLPPDLTLITLACVRNACTAGTGGTIASVRYIVVATLPRARLVAMLKRGSIEDASDQVESLRSLGMKKCCSSCGVEAAELAAVLPGSAGTGGIVSPGDSGGDRTVTPGM